MRHAPQPQPFPETSHREIFAATEAAEALADAAITSCRWKRPVSASRADSVKRWAANFPEEGRTAIVSKNAASTAVAELMAGMRFDETARWLALDMRNLAGLYLRLTGSESCRIKLDLVKRQACRRFHYDYLTLRMLCTYAGAGTLWVAREDVHLPALDEAAGDLDAQNGRIVPNPARIQSCAVGDVLWLKGALHPACDGVGAVHRSPFASPGSPRLVLTIDSQLVAGA